MLSHSLSVMPFEFGKPLPRPRQAIGSATRPGLEPTAPDEVCGDSNPCGKEEGNSNLAVYQQRSSPGVELWVQMLFDCVVDGPADPATKLSGFLFIVSGSRVEKMPCQEGIGDPAHFDPTSSGSRSPAGPRKTSWNASTLAGSSGPA